MSLIDNIIGWRTSHSVGYANAVIEELLSKQPKLKAEVDNAWEDFIKGDRNEKK